MQDRTGLGRSIALVVAGMLLVAVPLALGSYMLFGNWWRAEIRGDVKKTLPRPGGGATALLVRQEAWEDYIDRVYLRADDGYLNSVFRSERDYSGPPDIEWKSPDTLVIRMKCGDIGEYQNNFDYTLNGKLKKGAVALEGNAPCPEPE